MSEADAHSHEVPAAADTGFGSVSRWRGRLFESLLLVGTLVGVVALAVLLAYVFVDAVRPFSADRSWYLLAALGVVVPIAATVAGLRRYRPAALLVGLATVGLGVSGLLLSALGFLVLEVYPPMTWLGLAGGAALPVAAARLYRRARPDASGRARTIGPALAVPGAIAGAALLADPPVRFLEWTTLAALFAPAAYLALRWRLDRVRSLAGALVVPVGGLAVGTLLGVGPNAGVLLSALAVLPVLAYAGHVLATDPERRVGLALPAMVVVTLVGTSVAVDALAAAGPTAWLDWRFLTTIGSTTPASAGVYGGLLGTVLIMLFVPVLAFPLGVGAAVYLEEYAPDNRVTHLISVNISNLAGVPSVVYGLLGLGLFVSAGGLTGGSVVVAAATLALLILPIVIISAQEAIQAVPDTMRQASYGMGATRWQTVREVVLPRAMPGILTGTILALSRAIGETAPLIMIGSPSVKFGLPEGLNSQVTAMPLQIFDWALRPQYDFRHGVVAAGVVTLLAVMLTMNSVAILLRNAYEPDSQ